MVAVLMTMLLAAALAPMWGAAVHAQGEEAGVTRGLAERAACGGTTSVRLSVDPPAGTESWLLVEYPPDDVLVSDVDPDNGGTYDADRGRIEWVSTNGSPAVHTYNITVPEDLQDSSMLSFDGEYRFQPAMSERSGVTGHVGLTIDCVETQDAGSVAEIGTVVRSLPQTVECGSTFPVQLTVSPGNETIAWSIDEAPPAEVEVGDVDPDHNGDHNAGTGRVKWLALDGGPAEVTYNATAPEGGTRALTFAGEFMFLPGVREPTAIMGDEAVELACTVLEAAFLPLALVPLAAVGGFVYLRLRRR